MKNTCQKDQTILGLDKMGEVCVTILVHGRTNANKSKKGRLVFARNVLFEKYTDRKGWYVMWCGVVCYRRQSRVTNDEFG